MGLVDETEIQFRSTCRQFMECEIKKMVYGVRLINSTGNLFTLIRPCSSSEPGRRADIEALLGGRPIQLQLKELPRFFLGKFVAKFIIKKPPY